MQPGMPFFKQAIELLQPVLKCIEVILDRRVFIALGLAPQMNAQSQSDGTRIVPFGTNIDPEVQGAASQKLARVKADASLSHCTYKQPSVVRLDEEACN